MTEPAGHGHLVPAGKRWVRPFLLGTGCLKVSFKGVLPIMAVPTLSHSVPGLYGQTALAILVLLVTIRSVRG